MHIPRIYEPYQLQHYPALEGPFYQLTVGANHHATHKIAAFDAEPEVGDEIGLKMDLLAGVTVYEVSGIQHTANHPATITLFLSYLRQDY